MGRSLLSLLVLAAIVAYGFGVWLFLLRSQDGLPARWRGRGSALRSRSRSSPGG
jgi:hypothetical protein